MLSGLALKMIMAYLSVDAVLFLCTILILKHITGDLADEYALTQLRRMLSAFLVYLCADTAWALCYHGAVSAPEAAGYILEQITLYVSAVIGYFWFCYASAQVRSRLAHAGFIHRFAWLPMIAIALFHLSRYRTGDFTPNEYLNGASLLPILLAAVYFLIGIGMCIRRAVHADTQVEKKEALAQIRACAAPLLCIMIDNGIHGTPLLALGIFSSLLMFYLHLVQTNINHDALTGLANRRRLSVYAERCLHHAHEQNSFCLYMIDVNSFKKINDRCGHQEGDKALQMVSAVLKDEAERCGLMAARWGGDEFVLAGPDCPKTKDLAEKINAALAEQCEKQGVPFTLSASVGKAVSSSDQETLASLILQADDEMYQAKETFHAMH